MAPRPQLTGTLDAVLRKGILVAADNTSIRRAVRSHGMRFGASRFVAGETLDQCVAVLRRLNDHGLYANTTLLGEGVLEPGETAGVVRAYRAIIDRIADERLRANVALKLTHLGLDVDEELALQNVRDLVERATERDGFIRIDMEQSKYVSKTLSIYRRLRESGLTRVGTVLQAYLYRTPDDLAALLPLEPNLRLVKGAYLEPHDIAYAHKADVDDAYARLMERMLAENGHTAIATHDERLIERAIRFASESGIARDRFEFQMLYGVRPQLQLALVRRGYKVLVATPFGPDWYPYLMRRIGERPANLLFFARAAIKR
jgi:proline dehydrogenase